MAHLMLFFQYMRVKREKNAETANQLKLNRKLNRIKKNIQNVTKRYTSIMESLNSQQKMMTSQAEFQSQAKLAGVMQQSGVFGGACTLADGIIGSILSSGKYGTIDATTYKNILAGMQANGGSLKKADGSYIDALGTDAKEAENLATEFQKAQYGIQSYTTTVQQQVAQEKQAAAQQIQSIFETKKEYYEMEQDQMLEPLNYEETMYDEELTYSKARCEELQAEEDSLKEKLSERIKDDVPKFGLS